MDQPRTTAVFEIAGVWFGVDAALVEAFAPDQSPMRLPQAPGHILGLVKLHDRVVPALDLARFLDLGGSPDAPSEAFSRLVVVRALGMSVAIPASRVRGLLELPKGEPASREAIEHARVREFATARVEAADGPIVILDIDAVLEAARIRPAA